MADATRMAVIRQAGPNPEPAADVSPLVMTVSVASDFGVGFDHDANSAVRTGAANTDFDDLFRAHYDRLVRSR